MPEFACPECGQPFEPLSRVAIGDAGGYQPVFGGPVILELGRCDDCNIDLERVGGAEWRRQDSH